MKRVFILFLCVIMMATLFAGCEKEFNQLAMPKKGDIVAEIVVRDYGTIYVKLFEDAAPKAVENFTTHAKEGYYDGLTFYRILNNSVVESGDPTGTGLGGESIWGEDFKDEFSPDLQPYYGALCMANSGPDTNGSRFFIVPGKKTYSDEVLDQIERSYDIEFNKTARKVYGTFGGEPWFYRLNTVFGQMYLGYDVLNRILSVEKSNEELGIPAEEVIIDRINILEYEE